MAKILSGISYEVRSAILPKCFAFGLFVIGFGTFAIIACCYVTETSEIRLYYFLLL